MWPRKQLDITGPDLLFAARQLITARARPADCEVVGPHWIPPDEALVCLSVRTGWDLLLAALGWPPGGEIVMSAVTISDMPRIVGRHGLVPVPVAVDADRLQPSPDDVERAITPRTRAILVAHLFGSRADIGPIITIARRHKLLVFEDCAQAYVGPRYSGHPETDAALFSFGPIKTATALGGAVLRIRNSELHDRMNRRLATYPLQSRLAYAARLAKYVAFAAACQRRIFSGVVRCCHWLSIDFDRGMSGVAHSFGSAAFFDQIRRQPCAPLLHLLQHRLAAFGDDERLQRRTTRGWRLAGRLPPRSVLGALNQSHTFWVLPVRVPDPTRILTPLRAAGFDATSRSSLVVVPGATSEARENPIRLAPWLRETVFLPNGDDMTDDEFDRMIAVLIQATARHKSRRDSRYPRSARMPAVT